MKKSCFEDVLHCLAEFVYILVLQMCVWGEGRGGIYIFIHTHTIKDCAYRAPVGLTCHREKVGCLARYPWLGIVGACIRNLACDTK